MREKNNIYFWLSILFLGSNFYLIVYIFFKKYDVKLEPSFLGSLFGALITGGVAILLWYAQKSNDNKEKERLKSNIEQVFIDAHKDVEYFFEHYHVKVNIDPSKSLQNNNIIKKISNKIFINNENLKSLDAQIIINGLTTDDRLMKLLNYRYYYKEFVINLENVQSRRFGSFLLPEADIYAIREKLNENIK